MKETITLIDAYSQIYRGFYALPQLSNSKGQFTNAIFATAKFLISLDREYYSPYGAVVFDKGRPEHRMRIIPEYKAQRPPMPEELRGQLPQIRDLIEAFGWRIVEKEGQEADDIIAAIAVTFKESPVRIVSADKDIAQVIDDRIKMLIPGKGTGGFVIQGPDEVLARFAVKPSQIVDYLSLIGDNSDNIPGIDGVGPKTAAKLINQFGSIDNLLANTAQIGNEKLRAKISGSAEFLKKNRQIISLDLSLPDDFLKDVEYFHKRKPDIGKLKAMADDLDLKSIKNDLEKMSGEGSPVPSPAPAVKPSMKKKDEMFTPDLFG
ncbi:MAG: 5'-3' exonuclease H3TH domain-containing protein [Victivallales bacterium]